MAIDSFNNNCDPHRCKVLTMTDFAHEGAEIESCLDEPYRLLAEISKYPFQQNGRGQTEPYAAH